MNKLLSIAIVFCFISAGVGAMAIQPTTNNENKFFNQTLKLSINDLIIKETEEEYIRVSFSQNDQYLLNLGKPILPKFTKIFVDKVNGSNPKENVFIVMFLKTVFLIPSKSQQFLAIKFFTQLNHSSK